MKVIKDGGHRLLANDAETAAVVSGMLLDLEKNGLDAVRRYSEKFDHWKPADFELSAAEIREATRKLDPQVVKRVIFCSGKVFYDLRAGRRIPGTVTGGPRSLQCSG